MEAILYSKARNNLRELINKVCDDYDEFIIKTKDDKSAILISYEEYKGLKETLYLLSSKNNRDRLLDSINEIEKGDYKIKDI
jgi:antitoxin YefM